jgi:hypothetical protein
MNYPYLFSHLIDPKSIEGNLTRHIVAETAMTTAEMG